MPLANCFLQPLSRGLHFYDSDISGNPFHGVRDAFGQLDVSARDCG